MVVLDGIVNAGDVDVVSAGGAWRRPLIVEKAGVPKRQGCEASLQPGLSPTRSVDTAGASRWPAPLVRRNTCRLTAAQTVPVSSHA